MKPGLIYIHGKGGSAIEAAHYQALFPAYDVTGWDYQAQTPWEAQAEFPRLYESFHASHAPILLIANSIGAYFAMHALDRLPIQQAYFISPIVNMERLILDMMQFAQVTEDELKARGTIDTPFGESLSWDYLSWVRTHPLTWHTPTAILYGAQDRLQSLASIQSFAAAIAAPVTILQNGEHWFHTEEQMAFLDRWIQTNPPPAP